MLAQITKSTLIPKSEGLLKVSEHVWLENRVPAKLCRRHWSEPVNGIIVIETHSKGILPVSPVIARLTVDLLLAREFR